MGRTGGEVAAKLGVSAHAPPLRRYRPRAAGERSDAGYRLYDDADLARLHAILVGLGRMYVDDPRFAASYERVAPGLAAYLRDAIEALHAPRPRRL